MLSNILFPYKLESDYRNFIILAGDSNESKKKIKDFIECYLEQNVDTNLVYWYDYSGFGVIYDVSENEYWNRYYE